MSGYIPGMGSDKMSFIQEFFSNYILIAAILSWLAAQVLKTIIDFFLNRKFHKERLIGAGGMPSSHSALVCAFMVATARQYSLSSFEFALSFVFAIVVMYDAMGVRRAAGEQAKVLNLLVDNLSEDDDSIPWPEKKLKEYLGHTPTQVLAGAILGAVIALLL